MFKTRFSLRYRYVIIVPAMLICCLLATSLPAYASGVGPTPAPQRMAGSCSGAGCYGKDPYVWNCANNPSVDYAQATDGYGNVLATVWNYYSSGCNANWGQAELSSLAISESYSLVVLIKTPPTGNYTEQQCYPDNCSPGYTGPYKAWTNMIDGTKLTRATVQVFDRNGFLVSTNYVNQ